MLPTDPRRQAAIDWLYGRINYEGGLVLPHSPQALRLDRVRQLLIRLGSPDAGRRVVHVAGTKGKGSTSKMMASILTAAGYRTALYTSPHLERIEERFEIDGLPCSGEELVGLVERLRPLVAEMDRRTDVRGPTFFDIATAMAFLLFADRQCDVIVLEVGLGGRLDSTNVCWPAVSVITSISLDHTKQLGDTVEQIAAEKAGIIKPGVPVVSGVTEPGPRGVIARIALQHGCRLLQRGEDFGAVYAPPGAGAPLGTAQYWSHAAGTPVGRPPLPLALAGRRQAENAAVALAVIDELTRQGLLVSEDSIQQGLAAAKLPVRFELFGTRPTAVIDCAHNEASALALAQTLADYFPRACRDAAAETAVRGPSELTIALAISRDKDAAAIVRALAPVAGSFVATRFLENPRSMTPEQVADVVAREAPGASVRLAADPLEAWTTLMGPPRDDDQAGCNVVCFTGSLFFAAEVRRLATRRTASVQASPTGA
ncbi:Folylpolyglutamate synthase [Pirellulimonas nuda]|uniref:Dihydrofolate synthase/folylpolyglutamate synthase n=1 Tax=Pirellulimonas nuda TaxID=2528009 RepID=A0A518DH50_9BACT|nr:folylpolyglutamate synthase/dihydrofolate synthase family protein [Pirellulimonas nuda]QDU90799.1 Folylpolyglutamate synthase [Pirellulimonas nuda]